MSDTATFILGAYIVRIGLRSDNPAFPVFIIYRGKKFIGKQFSRPCETDCQWLEREECCYATESRTLQFSTTEQRSRAGLSLESRRSGTAAERYRRNRAMFEAPEEELTEPS